MSIRNLQRLSTLGIRRRRRITNSFTSPFVQKMMFEVCRAQTGQRPNKNKKKQQQLYQPYIKYILQNTSRRN